MQRQIFQSGETYSFSRYFAMPFTVREILREFEFSYTRKHLNLLRSKISPDLTLLKQQLDRNQRRMPLTNEMARREALISPVLLEISDLTDRQILAEYAVSVNEYLKGTLDYYLTDESETGLLIIEAKQSDLVHGFTQLAVELIALDQWTRSQSPLLYGVVTTGDRWVFGVLDRAAKTVTEDDREFAIAQLDDLVSVLLGILG
jgi:hypothetical protein